MNFLSLIEAKRAGATLTPEEIQAGIRAFTAGTIPDYQMAAFLMAIFFRGLNTAETTALTLAMRDSGDVLEFPKDKRPLVDKHSTGGVGDKVSLPLAPLLACLGFRVPMISGRGLGITGGTLDKLDSIPGYKTLLPAKRITEIVQEVGCAICGQTERMVPADKKLYALRDVTGTVPSIPLITASILSKKLSEGIEALLLDVKFGSAAFMPALEKARALARSMTAIAGESGVKTCALLTDMNSPLGAAAGNWLEVKESVQCLEGTGPADLRELVIDCAAHLLVLTQKAVTLDSARAQAQLTLASGAPRRKWDEMLNAQGADLDAFQARLKRDHTAPEVAEILAPRSGFVRCADARIIGEVVRDLGGGRMTKEAEVDYDVGVDRVHGLGAPIEAGDALCRIHARSPGQLTRATQRLAEAFAISPSPVRTSPRIVEVI